MENDSVMEYGGLTVDKRNGDICFNEGSHVYFDRRDLGKRYVSVTTLLHRFEGEFDKAFWSAYKALEGVVDKELWPVAKGELLSRKVFDDGMLGRWGVDPAVFGEARAGVVAGWEAENLKSTERGTRIHAELENSFYCSGGDVSLRSYGIGGKFVCDRGRVELDLENGVYPEYLIHYESPDGKVLLAGQIDLLVRDGDEFVIIDWKTNKEIKRKSYYDSKVRSSVKLKYPLNDLDDCNYSVYNMQLSVYAWMLRQMHPEWRCRELVLVHFRHDGGRDVYRMDYLEGHVEKMIAWWRKEVVLEERRAKRRRVEY